MCLELPDDNNNNNKRSMVVIPQSSIGYFGYVDMWPHTPEHGSHLKEKHDSPPHGLQEDEAEAIAALDAFFRNAWNAQRPHRYYQQQQQQQQQHYDADVQQPQVGALHSMQAGHRVSGGGNVPRSGSTSEMPGSHGRASAPPELYAASSAAAHMHMQQQQQQQAMHMGMGGPLHSGQHTTSLPSTPSGGMYSWNDGMRVQGGHAGMPHYLADMDTFIPGIGHVSHGAAAMMQQKQLQQLQQQQQLHQQLQQQQLQQQQLQQLQQLQQQQQQMQMQQQQQMQMQQGGSGPAPPAAAVSGATGGASGGGGSSSGMTMTGGMNDQSPSNFHEQQQQQQQQQQLQQYQRNQVLFSLMHMQVCSTAVAMSAQ